MTTKILSGPEFAAKWGSLVRHREAPTKTQAFVYSGTWVVDCCYPDCYSCQAVEPGDTFYHCANCQYTAEVEWPPNAAQIEAILSRRPVPSTRYWAPAGHRQAIACGFPEGQTAADLMEENEAYL